MVDGREVVNVRLTHDRCHLQITTVRLDDLIDGIKKVHSDPLEQLTDAALAADHLGELADHLVGHFVDQARRSGRVVDRHRPQHGRVTSRPCRSGSCPSRPGEPAEIDPEQGFTRFTPRARNVVVASQEEARRLGNAQIGTAHLVLGLLSEPESLAIVRPRRRGRLGRRDPRRGDPPRCRARPSRCRR